MNENIERVLAALDGFRMSDEMTYSAYSTLHDEISLLDDLLKGQTTIGWVSVKDRLPEVGGKYLIRDKTDVTIGTLMLIDKRNGLWQWADSDFYGRGGITHWMPLPEPPKEEKE